jgi:carboxymethylenebutenolidase
LAQSGHHDPWFVADYRPSYRKGAAEDAWNKMTAWFKRYGVLS